jgi:hypothetical protein
MGSLDFVLPKKMPIAPVVDSPLPNNATASAPTAVVSELFEKRPAACKMFVCHHLYIQADPYRDKTITSLTQPKETT